MSQNDDFVRYLAEFHNINVSVMQSIFESIAQHLDAVAPRVEPPVSESGEGFESPSASYTHIAIISPTYRELEVRFNKMLEEYKNYYLSYSLSQKYIQLKSIKFSFFTLEYPEKLRGHLFDHISIDEGVRLTYEQIAMLMLMGLKRP